MVFHADVYVFLEIFDDIMVHLVNTSLELADAVRKLIQGCLQHLFGNLKHLRNLIICKYFNGILHLVKKLPLLFRE